MLLYSAIHPFPTLLLPDGGGLATEGAAEVGGMPRPSIVPSLHQNSEEMPDLMGVTNGITLSDWGIVEFLLALALTTHLFTRSLACLSLFSEN